MLSRLLSVLSTVLAALLVASCIDGEEEIWIEPNGSGRLVATYRLPPALLSEFGGPGAVTGRLAEAFAREPGFTVHELSAPLEDGRIALHLDLSFDDVRTLAAFPSKHLRDPENPDEPSPEALFFGTIDLEIRGLVLEFDRRVDLAPALPEAVLRNPALLGGARFTYVLHLPTSPTGHDADQTRDGGRTLEWSFLLRETAHQPLTMHTRSLLPLPWWVWVAAGALLAGLIALAILWRRKRRLPTGPSTVD